MEQTCLNIRKLIHKKNISQHHAKWRKFQKVSTHDLGKSVCLLYSLFFLSFIENSFYSYNIYCDYSFPSSLLLPVPPHHLIYTLSVSH